MKIRILYVILHSRQFILVFIRVKIVLRNRNFSYVYIKKGLDRIQIKSVK